MTSLPLQHLAVGAVPVTGTEQAFIGQTRRLATSFYFLVSSDAVFFYFTQAASRP